MKENEEVPNNHMFYKISVDMENKTVKVSKSIVQECKETFDVLVKCFKDFEFIEFCNNYE